jgi:hypothetical protein
VATVSSARVLQFEGLCGDLAATLARPGTRGINGVEFDDLVQEGRIAIWQALERGVAEGNLPLVARGRMVDYQRWLGRQGVPYSKLLPIEDLS